MVDDIDDDDPKEEWQKDLKSWKNRRKSVSSTKRETAEESPEPQIARSLKNRKWNKYSTVDNDDYGNNADKDDYDDDETTKFTNHRFNHSRSMTEQTFLTSPSSSSSSSWPPKVAKSSPASEQNGDTNAIHYQAEKAHLSAVDSGHSTDEAFTGNRTLQEKTIKISQRPNNSKGFGFEIKGGRENDEPISISKVTRGSSGDINDLRIGDVILSLNGIDVNHHYMDSVEQAIEEAVKKGTIELKIKRSRTDDGDDMLSDDEEFEVRQRTPSLMWSGSVSSRHSTPPLPPQPDYNESLVEASPAQHLPLAPPPPPVNWNTFPEDQRIEDFDESSVPELEVKTQSKESSDEVTPSTVLENSQQSNYKSYIPSHDTSSFSTSSSFNQIRESQTVKRYEFLGLEPDKSEELKALKETKISTQISKQPTNYETGFSSVVEKDKPPSNHVQDFVAENKDSSSKQLKADIYSSGKYRTLFGNPKNDDGSSQLKSSSTDKNALNSANYKSPSNRSSYDVIKSKFEFDDKHSIKGQQMQQADSSSKKLLDYNGRQAQPRPSKIELKHSRSEDHGLKQIKSQTVVLSSNIGGKLPTIYSTTHAVKKRENIENLETGRNAAAEWKKRDKEMKEKEEKEHEEMLKRQNDFNRENSHSNFSSEVPSRSSVSLATAAKTPSYDSFVKESTTSNSAVNRTEAGTAAFIYASFASNNKTEKDKGIENMEQPKLNVVTSSKIVNNSTPSYVSESSKAPSVGVSELKDATFTTSVKLSDAGFGLKTTQYKPIKLNLDGSNSSSSAGLSIKLNNSSFKPASSFMSNPEAQENMIRNEIEQNLALNEHSNESVQSNKPAAKEQPSYQFKESIKPNMQHLDSLREEEMKLQKIREEQEIEKIRLERIQEEKKIEEIKLLRLTEEEEMKKLKEQRKLKEEAEFKKTEMSKLKPEKDGREKYEKTESGTYILSSSEIIKSSYPLVNQNANSAVAMVSNAPKPFQSINKPPAPLDFEANEGNPYSRATRAILTDAGLTYDKTRVRSMVLEKPNFYNDESKNQETFVKNDRDSFYGSKVFPVPALPAHLQTYGDSRSTAQDFPKYSSANFQSLDSQPFIHQAGSYSAANPAKAETHSYRPTDISSLLYGESQKSDDNWTLYGKDRDVASNVNKSYHSGPFNNNKSNTLGPSRNESSAAHNYDKAKQLSNHWIVKEAGRRMGIDKDESAEPPNPKKEASNYISTAVASFRERSKSGTLPAEPKQISESDFVQLRPQHARRESSSSYNFDGTHSKPDHHSSYGHQQFQHSRSSSISTGEDSNTLALRGESFSATNRLYPPESRLSTSGLDNSAKIFAGNSPNRNYGSSSFYSPSSAVDSLFNYNHPPQGPGYIANQQETNQRQSNFQQPSQLNSRKISLSTANLRQDYDTYENNLNRNQYQSNSRTNVSRFQNSPQFGDVAPAHRYPSYVSSNENNDRFGAGNNYYYGNNN